MTFELLTTGRLTSSSIYQPQHASVRLLKCCLSTKFLAVLLAAVSQMSLTAEESWPCFRGYNRTGVSNVQGLPSEWSDSKNIVWKTALPGPGASSPVTFGDHIYVTCYSGYGLNREAAGQLKDLKRHLLCLSRKDGRLRWKASCTSEIAEFPYADFVNNHGYASSTPAVDDTGIYVFYGPWGVRAYHHTGELKWERMVGTRNVNFGSAASPVLFDGLVILNASVESESLVALSKSDGRQVWRVAVPVGESRSTPLVVQWAGAFELIYHLGEGYEGGQAKRSGIGSLDPRNGNKLWECMSVNAYLNASPIVNDGIIYAVANRAVAVRPGGKGDVTKSNLLWEIKEGSEVGTPVFYKGHLYWANQDGIACCVDAKNGKVVYKERLNPPSGRVYASGIIADGKLYYVSRENGAYVLPAEPRFEVLAHNRIDADQTVFNATPAVSRGALLLRSDSYLYCIGQK
jgi:outer membrane protein assembly factor BamB